MPGSRRHRPRPDRSGRSPPPPHEGSPSRTDRRSTTRMGWAGSTCGPPSPALIDGVSPPSGGRGGPAGCRPAPWPVASVFFHNPVVGHTRNASLQGVVVARIHPRTWTLDGYLGSLNHSRWGRYSGVAPSVARRAGPRMMGSWPRRIGVAGGRLPSGGSADRAGPDRRGQAPKGTGGMPRRHQMAGVEGRERSGGAAQRASIPECPLDTRGTETSQYPQEKKSTETPSVAASERGPA